MSGRSEHAKPASPAVANDVGTVSARSEHAKPASPAVANEIGTVTAQDFATSVDRLLAQVRHWGPARWRPSRADLVYALVQRLADLGADAEHRPRRPVPRIGDLVLPDQLRVMADDLLAAAPPDKLIQQATDEVNAARHSL